MSKNHSQFYIPNYNMILINLDSRRNYYQRDKDSLPMNYIFLLEEQCKKHMEYLESIEIKCFSWGELYNIDKSRIEQYYDMRFQK